MAGENILGTVDADILAGGAEADVIDALDGADVVAGGGGADEIHGGDGDDVLAGESGGDTIIGDRGSDVMLGGGGADTMVWNNGDGSDVMIGGAGFDRAVANGSDGGDLFEIRSLDGRIDFQRVNFGTFSLDIRDTEKLIVSGLGGDDTIDASGLDAGSIELRAIGGAGKDVLIGGAGDDLLEGGAGADILEGEKGNDTMRGGLGRDRMEWDNGDGSDLMDGGYGHDTADVDGAETAGDHFEIRSTAGGVEFERINLGNFTLAPAMSARRCATSSRRQACIPAGWPGRCGWG
ncbi:calcium-binding protein [Mangrovicoccus ximenensis]|uniref:calcium-binding protein n=1 Tax=Mangrovicoccus ximenensis TaxID=1911570 RepID=UPI000D381270|nr:calcium-binding protein [Mangrovicoccus ximenensis]